MTRTLKAFPVRPGAEGHDLRQRCLLFAARANPFFLRHECTHMRTGCFWGTRRHAHWVSIIGYAPSHNALERKKKWGAPRLRESSRQGVASQPYRCRWAELFLRRPQERRASRYRTSRTTSRGRKTAKKYRLHIAMRKTRHKVRQKTPCFALPCCSTPPKDDRPSHIASAPHQGATPLVSVAFVVVADGGSGCLTSSATHQVCASGRGYQCVVASWEWGTPWWLSGPFAIIMRLLCLSARPRGALSARGPLSATPRLVCVLIWPLVAARLAGSLAVRAFSRSRRKEEKLLLPTGNLLVCSRISAGRGREGVEEGSWKVVMYSGAAAAAERWLRLYPCDREKFVIRRVFATARAAGRSKGLQLRRRFRSECVFLSERHTYLAEVCLSLLSSRGYVADGGPRFEREGGGELIL